MSSVRSVLLALALAVLSGCACFDDHKHLSYGADPEQGFDWYEPKGPLCIGDDDRPNRPAIIAIHGGGWQSGDKSWGEQVAEEFCGSGYVVFSINYRLAPAASFRVDPNRIGAFGVSAGGHLAAMLALRPNPTGSGALCAVSANGEGDLTVYGQTPIMANETALLEAVLGPQPFAPAALADLSPTHWVQAGSSPVWVVHSTGDSNVYFDQGRRLHEALVANGVTTGFTVVEDDCHGKCWKSSKALSDIRAFFRRNLRGT